MVPEPRNQKLEILMILKKKKKNTYPFNNYLIDYGKLEQKFGMNDFISLSFLHPEWNSDVKESIFLGFF